MSTTKDGLHPRNRFRTRYDFLRLIAASPALGPFVRLNEHGDDSIDYADPQAVKALNQALLKEAYGLQHWDLPPGYLCPPIPGRGDYVHYLADLIAGRQGPRVRVLDIGTGANCIYPLIGASEYGWSFVAAELDPTALRWARKLAAANAQVAALIECRQQTSATRCFHGMIRPAERFDLTLCNPPFHASAAEAAAGTRRKTAGLGGKKDLLNFGGRPGELWCEGGELAFIRRMIAESADFAKNCGWFTTLVSKNAHLPALEKAVRQAGATMTKIIPMAQGQKKSRILAWSFQKSAAAGAAMA